MGDTLDSQGKDALHEKDYRSEIQQLRGEMQQIYGEIERSKQDAIREALSQIVIQVGGSGLSISGGNGKFTVSGNIPTGGTVTGTFDCTVTPQVFNGTLSLT